MRSLTELRVTEVNISQVKACHALLLGAFEHMGFSGPFQTPCLSRAELNSLFKFDYGTAVSRRLKPFKN